MKKSLNWKRKARCFCRQSTGGVEWNVKIHTIQKTNDYDDDDDETTEKSKNNFI